MPERAYWGEPTDAEGGEFGAVVWVLRVGSQSRPPLPADDTWTLWYKDLFDLDTPTELHAQGEGLVRGLLELWIQYLREGFQGLSRFSLACTARTYDIEARKPGDREAIHNLRLWAFQAKGEYDAATLKTANFTVLVGIAAGHAKLIQSGRTLEPLLQLARSAPDAAKFLLGLATL